MLQPGSTIPPPALLTLWTPLLSHVIQLHPTFPAVLLERILNILVGSAEILGKGESSQESSKADASFDACIAAWVAWIIQTYEVPDDTESSGLGVHRADAVITLLSALGPTTATSVTRDRKACVLLQLPNLQRLNCMCQCTRPSKNTLRRLAAA
jgi:hypothetical protein